MTLDKSLISVALGACQLRSTVVAAVACPRSPATRATRLLCWECIVDDMSSWSRTKATATSSGTTVKMTLAMEQVPQCDKSLGDDIHICTYSWSSARAWAYHEEIFVNSGESLTDRSVALSPRFPEVRKGSRSWKVEERRETQSSGKRYWRASASSVLSVIEYIERSSVDLGSWWMHVAQSLDPCGWCGRGMYVWWPWLAYFC